MRILPDRLLRRLRTIRLRIVRRLSYTSRVHRAVIRLASHRRRNLPRADTELVIDGFPRSANSFSYCAFRVANPDVGHVAHHLHAPGQIAWAAQRGIPVMLLLRDPDEVALSEGVRSHHELEVGEILAWYRDFHTSLLPYRDRVVVIGFDQATRDLGAAIDAVNARFGTAFNRFEHTRDHVAQVFTILERHRLALFDEEDPRLWVGRPSAARDARKERLRPELDRDELRAVRAAAHEVFHTWTG